MDRVLINQGTEEGVKTQAKERGMRKEFANIGLAQAAAVASDNAFFNRRESDGYTVNVIGGVRGIIGKNATTGLDAPDAQRTIAWDTVKEVQVDDGMGGMQGNGVFWIDEWTQQGEQG